MNIETNRLGTFSNWPSSAPVDVTRVAKAGFFYTGEGTEVQCFSCGGKISEWNYGDQVMCRHRTMEPNCAFVVNPEGSGNVPLVDCPEPDTPTAARASEQPDSSRQRPYRGYGLTPEDEVYRNDELRLLSFVNWHDSSVSSEALADAGFYRTNEGRLRCAWCGGQLSGIENFGPLGHPLEVHRTYFPLCSFAAGLELAHEATAVSRSASPFFSYTPPLCEQPANDQPQSSGAVHNTRVLAGGTWRALGVVGGGARHPAYASLAARLATYHRWPTDRAQTPKALSDAGFFYTGKDDQVRCFYCDGGLGRWEAGDAPWTEHARWFPHCGFVLIVKGHQFIETCKATAPPPAISAESCVSSRPRNAGVTHPVSEAQVAECMESETSMAALGAGLDVARVRRAIVKRLRITGTPFTTSESLIDAALDEQLNEEEWSVTPRSQRLARDILSETLRDFAPRAGLTPSSQEESSDDRPSDSPPLTPTPTPPVQRSQPIQLPQQPTANSVRGIDIPTSSRAERDKSKTPVKNLTLEEENRQLKEARLCKVCMDNEVCVVFLPCGHLVSCGGCGAALAACPLCRCAVRALVRAYLA